MSELCGAVALRGAEKCGAELSEKRDNNERVSIPRAITTTAVIPSA